MSNKTARYSFEIKTPQDFLRKLHEEHRDFQSDPLSSRHAVNFAMTAWHLKDWVWAYYKTTIKTLESNIKDLDDFDAYLRSKCPELEIMQSIATGTKHVNVDRNQRKIQSTELHEGSFDSGFSRDFDVDVLQIILNDGSVVFFEDEAPKVLEFWEHLFVSYLTSPPSS